MRLRLRPCIAAIYSMVLLLPTQALAAFEGPVELLPSQAALPEPWGLLKLVLLLTFTLHLLLVNILIGSCLIALAGSFRKNTLISPFIMKDETAFITKVLALAVNLGVAPYLFMQVLYGSFFYPSTLLMSTWWMAIIGFVMLAYYGLYIISDKTTAGFASSKPILVFLTLMLLMTAFILTNNSSLMLRPDLWLAWVHDPTGTVLNTNDPTLVPRYLHVLVASVAIGGLAHAWLAGWKSKRNTITPAMAEEKIDYGLKWFRYATMAQILVGLWFFMTLAPEIRKVFMGGSAIATTALVLVLVGAVLVLFLAYRKNVSLLCMAMAALIFIMVAVRDMVRDTSLLPYLRVMDSPEKVKELSGIPLALENGQHIGFGIFVLCLLLAIFLIFWMAMAVPKAIRNGNTNTSGAAGALEE